MYWAAAEKEKKAKSFHKELTNCYIPVSSFHKEALHNITSIENHEVQPCILMVSTGFHSSQNTKNN